MAEINNNIPSFGRIGKIEKSRINIEEEIKAVPQNEEHEKKIVPDTGVLGRSLVKKTNGGDIAKSIDEAVDLAKNDPALLSGCESLFNSIYNDLVAQGVNESDAYMRALLAEEELLDISSRNR